MNLSVSNNILWKQIIPRPTGIFHKSPILIIGSLAGAILFQGRSYGKVADYFHNIPILSFMASVFLFWFAYEILISQGKYLWNDLDDYRYDISIQRQRLPLTPNGKNLTLLRTNLWGRIILGLFISGLLSTNLLALSSITLTLQAIYQKWAKKNHPLLVLFIVSAGFLLRVLVGLMAAGVNLSDRPHLLQGHNLFFVALMVLSTGYLANSSFFRAEAAEHRSKNLSQKNYGNFFLAHGRLCQSWSAIFLFLSGSALAIAKSLTEALPTAVILKTIAVFSLGIIWINLFSKETAFSQKTAAVIFGSTALAAIAFLYLKDVGLAGIAGGTAAVYFFRPSAGLADIMVGFKPKVDKSEAFKKQEVVSANNLR